MAEERVGEVLGVGFEGRKAAEGGRDLAAAVEDFDCRGVGGGGCWGYFHFGNVGAFGDHAEGGAESLFVSVSGTPGVSHMVRWR